MFKKKFFNVVLIVLAVSGYATPATDKALHNFAKLDNEIDYFGGYFSEKLLNCSYYQDGLLAYLHDAEDLNEYYRGMEEIDRHSKGFKSLFNWATSVFNFYTGEDEPPYPQEVEFADGRIGFLNTFKTGSKLSAKEREKYFNQEMRKYLRDRTVDPFVLDESTIDTLEEQTVYNFVLHADGTIHVALERKGEREYHVGEDLGVEEAFQYPNHTILAGRADEVVVSAGALIFYREGEKRLFFISSKSGHFQPSFDSLSYMRTRLSQIGINYYTIISTPDVDLSRFVLKLYNGAKVPISINGEDAARLFQNAKLRWRKVYETIDRDLLNSLAQGDLATAEQISAINKQREEATFMRSAFHLFTASHEAPPIFNDLVKYFGRLKGALNHKKMIKIQREAERVLQLMEAYDASGTVFTPASEESFYIFSKQSIARMRKLLAQESLTAHEYHDLKKLARELGALFMYVADDLKWKGRGYLINVTAQDAFFQINEWMCKSHNTYLSQITEKDGEIFVKLSPKIARQLTRYLDHLDIPPPRFSLAVEPRVAAQMINWAKQWYFTDHRFMGPDASDQQVMQLLKAVAAGQVSDFEALPILKKIHRDAESARNAIIFLDVRHGVPLNVNLYIEKLGCIIQGIESNQIEPIRDDARWMLETSSRNVINVLEDWKCTDQESFNAMVGRSLDFLHAFKKPILQVSEVRAHVQAFRDLIHLYRKLGSYYQNKLPPIAFDLLEEHADALLDALNGNVLIVTPELSAHAEYILSKVG